MKRTGIILAVIFALGIVVEAGQAHQVGVPGRGGRLDSVDQPAPGAQADHLAGQRDWNVVSGRHGSRPGPAHDSRGPRAPAQPDPKARARRSTLRGLAGE